jgi:hypothetical protein
MRDRSGITLAAFQHAMHWQFAPRDFGRRGRRKQRRESNLDAHLSDDCASLAQIVELVGNRNRRAGFC